MKSTIQGFPYNTEKAIFVGEADNVGDGAESSGDLMYWEAGLYLTPRKKRFFLAGRGGFLSRFNGKERIIPITRGEALAFACRFFDGETIKEHFESKGGRYEENN